MQRERTAKLGDRLDPSICGPRKIRRHDPVHQCAPPNSDLRRSPGRPSSSGLVAGEDPMQRERTAIQAGPLDPLVCDPREIRRQNPMHLYAPPKSGRRPTSAGLPTSRPGEPHAT
jgi:hypothetical protein